MRTGGVGGSFFRWDFAGADGGEGGHELGQDGGIGGRHVVRAENLLHLWSECSELGDRRGVGVEVGFGAEEPDGPRIVGVAGEEQAVGAVEKRNGVGRVTGRGDDFDGASAKIDFEAVVPSRNEERNVPGLRRVGLGLKFFGSSPQISPGAISACASSREPLALARVKAVSMP